MKTHSHANKAVLDLLSDNAGSLEYDGSPIGGGSGDMLAANNLSDVANAATSRLNLGLGTMATQAASAVAITGGTVAGLTGLAIRDTSAAYDVTLGATSSSALTAARGITLDVANASQTLRFTGASTVTFPAGTNTLASLAANTFTAAQTVALGTITASSPTSLTQTWNASGVTFTALDVNVTDTAKATGSMLMRVRRSGATADAFAVKVTEPYTYLTFGGTTGSAAECRIESRYGGMYLTPANTTGITILSDNGPLVFAANNAVVYTSLVPEAAATLAQRNGTNAQTHRVYGTYTDASNYVRASLAATSTSVTLAAETAGTGADNIDLTLTPAGTGVVQFGSHSALAAETVTGYITIKDSGGTTRKLAVVS